MKKLFILIGIITVCILPDAVNADVFTNNGVVYNLSSMDVSSIIDACQLDEYALAKFMGFDKKGNAIISDFDGNFKINKDGVCTSLTTFEYNEFTYNYRAYSYSYDNNGNTEDIYQEEYVLRNTEVGKVLSEDEEIKEYKTYYDFNNEEIISPNNENINTYYEEAKFHPVYTNKIKEETTYYVFNEETDHYDKVINANNDDILSYFIKVDLPEKSKIYSLDRTNIDPYYYLYDILTYENTPALLVYRSFIDGSSYKYYDTTGKEVFSGNKRITFYTNDLIGVVDGTSNGLDYSSFKFLNKNFEEIYDPNIEYILYSRITEDNTYIIYGTNRDKDKIYYLTVYNIDEGNNQEYNNDSLIFTFNGEYSKLNKVKVNNVELTSDKYIATEGSTIITLKKDYLRTLTKGNYTLKVEYTDGGYASAVFTIPEENPPTYDGIINYILFGGISIIGIVGCIIYFKKTKL